MIPYTYVVEYKNELEDDWTKVATYWSFEKTCDEDARVKSAVLTAVSKNRFVRVLDGSGKVMLLVKKVQ